MLGSKNIYTIYLTRDNVLNSDIYDSHKDLYLSKKEREEKLLQGIRSVSSLKACVGAKKVDVMALTVTTQEKAIKKTIIKGLQYL